jgi:hypothetical protein
VRAAGEAIAAERLARGGQAGVSDPVG